jgi:aspartyl-tRNA(Asn)/glutamyl-tRNA(Gln) amidotransferase subunit B
VDLGFPGVLPVLNEAVVKKAILFGTAIEAEIARRSVFARKNYFYPDLPKGYQISQFELPIVGPGHVDILLDEGQGKRIGVTRAHLEEDAGKSLHEDFHGMTGIDLNRAGTPLLEIVSEPDMRSAKEAVAYARKIHQIVVYLGICDGNMQEGSFRMDANVSVRPLGEEKLGTRTELKNLNSFRFLEKAINFEVERQIDVLEAGGEVVQETRLYDPQKDETRSMRSKEEANDYRYFPDPDLLPLIIDDDFIAATVKEMPELPAARRARFEEQYGLSAYDAEVLTATRQQADFYEIVVAEAGDAKLSANWVMVELAGALNKAGLDLADSPVSAERFGGLVKRIADNTISGKIAKTVFEAMWDSADSADAIIEARGLKQITDTGAIEAIVDEVLAENTQQVENYRNAPEDKQPKMLGFFVGQVMKKSQGKANPKQVNELLRDKLKG